MGCFKCGGIEHFSWKCPEHRMERRKGKKDSSVPHMRKCALAASVEKKVVCMARPQEA